MYRVDSSNNENPGVLGKSTYTVILTIQTSLVSRHTQYSYNTSILGK